MEVLCKEVFTSHESFLEFYKKTYCDFIYEVQSNTYYCLIIEDHNKVMAQLYTETTGDSRGNSWDRADKFILEGSGMFKSRASDKIFTSENFEFPKELWSIQRDVEVMK